MRGVTHTDRGRVKRSVHLSPCQVPHLVLDILSRTVHFVYLQEFPAFPQGWLIIICDVSCKEYLDIFGFFVCELSSLWCSPRLLSRAALWWALAAWLWWALAPWLWWLWLRGCGGLLAFLFLGGGLGLGLGLEVRGVLPIGESCLEALPWLRGCGGLSILSFLGCGLGLGVSLGMRGLLSFGESCLAALPFPFSTGFRGVVDRRPSSPSGLLPSRPSMRVWMAL